MRNFNIFYTLILLSFLFSTQSSATGFIGVKHVIVASGGDYIDPANKVKLYSYNTMTKEVILFDSLPGRFARDIVIDEIAAYISVDSMLYKYNMYSFQRADSLVVSGINRMAIHRNFLIISRWFPATGNYLEIYNKNDFSLMYRDTSINAFTKGITIINDTAYVAVTAFDIGKVAVISLTNNTPAFVKEINLDTTAKGIEDIYSDGNKLYTLSYPYGASYNALTTFDLRSGNITYDTMPKAMDGVGFEHGMLYANFGKGLQAYNTESQKLDKVISNMNYYRGIYDSIHRYYYLVDNNFSSNNKVYILNNDGEAIDTFEVGMSTEAIAFHYDNIASVTKYNSENQKVNAYPNPVRDVLNISSNVSGRSIISLKDITGKEVFTKAVNMQSGAVESISLENLPKGMYLLQLASGKEVSVKKIIIE